ncbi:hypothetical protein GGR56DRAFT_639244 [Xylariaceae sp. FL0804]|nr:hypothetical protein GGR56DRAFT_639244 [Xylariaceae sp. FL0804]
MTAVPYRFRTGPYGLSIVESGSSLQKGLVAHRLWSWSKTAPWYSARNASRRRKTRITGIWNGKRSTAAAWGSTTPQALADKAMGLEIVSHSPRRGKQWVFDLTPSEVGFEYRFGQGAGSTGYSGVVHGGLAG